ncbi:NAD-dependent succinate-semialdehyde dehydrogenase [Vreelandella venusta]|uniref:NAD-dependent succinate-semialdehyde dehydrogenase n=1 Tax=Vreelandella venusta TaxID=44935 RepID=A0AAP9ZBJ4_9GAMM|nr:NAD-dependent succinate-semialdehyde dehydrogenase [Halomonas venusta]MDW0359478.1 NAD-dependent succinate-semialdehyde dehydrogenase [Halomonas venusta]QRL02386.1 NAD-dependent succinate-semialdehyde dehydrogenase [Halomonas venusta]GEK49534.1 succinate-semialdehyde dehydrogenase [Halomonas venusta]
MSNSITTVNPATGETLETYALMDASQAKQIVEASHEAFLDWRLKPLEQRAKVVKAIGEALNANKEELAELMVNEMGKLPSQARQEVELCAGICNYTAKHGPTILADEQRNPSNGERGIVTYSPMGVIYGIQPWNFPAYQVVRYSIANIMAGNSVLLKHAENVTGSGLLLEKIYREAGLPENVFRTIIVSHDVSDEVIAHKAVRGVTLTGSDGAGRKVAAKAAEHLKKTVLELGSNDAYLVLDDADLDVAVKTCVTGRVFNTGQTCVAAKRFVVTDANYEAFKARFVEKMKALKVGDPRADDTHLGPMARVDLRDALHEQVEQSVRKGAKILCGGEKPSGKGAFYPVTVLENVTPGQPAYDDELFGPVAALIRAKDDEDAMRIANDSRYGLGGGIISKDVQRATELASKYFDTGMVFINGFGVATPEMPFGGVKDSGYGREHGGFGMLEFVNAKSVIVVKE